MRFEGLQAGRQLPFAIKIIHRLRSRFLRKTSEDKLTAPSNLQREGTGFAKLFYVPIYD